MLYPNSKLYPQHFIYPNGSFTGYLITDRTQEDVDLVKELTIKMLDRTATDKDVELWTSDLKGAINKSDIERIENVVKHTQKLFNLKVTDDSIPTFISTDYTERLLSDVDAIIDSPYVNETSVNVPSQPLNTYQKWNDIENILLQALNTYTSNEGSYEYAGDNYFGNDNRLI